MTQRNTKGWYIVAPLCALLSTAAYAAPVTWGFNGTISHLQGLSFGENDPLTGVTISFGDAVSGQARFDPSLVTSTRGFQTNNIRFHVSPVQRMDVNFSGGSWSMSQLGGGGQIEIDPTVNNTSRDRFTMVLGTDPVRPTGSPSGPNLSGFPFNTFQLSLSGEFGLTSNALITSPPTLEPSANAFGQLQFGSSPNRGDVRVGFDISNVFLLGATQETPLLPDVILTPATNPTFRFVSAPSGAWFDPTPTSAFDFAIEDGSLFTEILALPEGFDGPFGVRVSDTVLGEFGAGESVDFVQLLGGGVAAFTVFNINPEVDAENPNAFPIRLAFDMPTATFTMAAAPVPIPGAIWLIGPALASIRLLRRKPTREQG